MTDWLVGLRATLLLGAMRADAAPEQREEIRIVYETTKDAFMAGKLTWAEWLGGFMEIMGPDWRPTGEWAAQLKALED